MSGPESSAELLASLGGGGPAPASWHNQRGIPHPYSTHGERAQSPYCVCVRCVCVCVCVIKHAVLSACLQSFCLPAALSLRHSVRYFTVDLRNCTLQIH